MTRNGTVHDLGPPLPLDVQRSPWRAATAADVLQGGRNAPARFATRIRTPYVEGGGVRFHLHTPGHFCPPGDSEIKPGPALVMVRMGPSLLRLQDSARKRERTLVYRRFRSTQVP